MKQKIFALFATGLVIVAGVITPAINFIAGTIEFKHAYAQGAGGGGGAGGGATTTTSTGGGAGGGVGPVTSVGDPVAPTGGEATGTEATEIECGLNFICAALMVSSQIFMFMPNLLATVTGLVMDFSLWYSMQSSTYTAYDGTVGDEGIVVTGWKLVRDFSNLLFIFALFVIAFTLILGLDERAEGAPMGLDPKRTIARVIIMALLVNFSFFLGRSVIDITNVVGLTFYNKITAAPQATPGDSTAASSDVKGGPGDPASFYENAVGIRSISTGILAQVNPQSLLLGNKDVHGSGTFWKSYDWSTYISIWFLTFVSAAFNIFLMYIFGTIAILFLSRTIGLFLGIIISPIAFVSYTIPALQKKSFIGFDDWLKQFLGLAFMAPIFLFFLYIALQFFHISGLDKGSGYLATTAQILVKLALVGFLLVYAKNVAKDLSGKMGEMTSNAITSLATGAAVVAGVAATGGISGMARLGGRMAKEQLLSGGNSLGKAAFGEEKYAAMSKQWDRAGGFSMLKGRGIVSGVKTISRVATAGSESGLGTAFGQGRVINRQYDIEQAKKRKAELEKQEKAKKAWDAYSPEALADKKAIADIDKKLEQAKKDKDENIISNEDYKKQTKELNQQKRNLQLPRDQRDSKEADKNLTEAKKRVGDKKNDKALTDATTKQTALAQRITTAENAVNEADQRLLDIAKEKAQTANDLAIKEQELVDAQKLQVPILKDLTDKRDQALAHQKDLADKVTNLDKEQALAEKFGSSNDVEKIKQDRAAVLAEKQSADRDVADTSQNLIATKSGFDTGNQALTRDRDALRDKVTDLTSEEARTSNKKATNESAKNAAATEKVQADAERNRIEAEQQADSVEIARLSEIASLTKEYENNNKEKDKIEKEFNQRNISKTDTDNRARNQDRLQDLANKLGQAEGKKVGIKDRLRDITGGGTTP
jgi:hypothetical protein